MDKEILYRTEEEIRRLGTKCDYKLVLMQNHEDTISIRDGETEQMLHATALSMAINLIIDGRDGFFYTNNLQPEAIKAFVRNAALTTQMLEPDNDRTLANPERYYKGNGPKLLNFDPTLSTMDSAEKVKIALENNREGCGMDTRIINFRTRYSDRQHKAHYLISNGFEGYEESSRCNITSIVSAEGEGGQHPMDGWGETRIFFRDIPREGIAREAVNRTIRKIGQRPVKSGQYAMILESPVAGNFLQPLLNAMSGQALQQQTSFLMGKDGEQVLSPLITIIDNPLIPGTRGACHFDYDGVATSVRTIFDQGVLKTYFIDTIYGNKLGMKPTTQGIHHLIMEQGSKSLQQLISEADNCILVTDFNGGNCDPSTGNFSYGIEGFLIQGGVLTQPVSGMNITGNMLDVWKSVTELANDADPWETELIPSIKFEGISFGGTSSIKSSRR